MQSLSPSQDALSVQPSFVCRVLHSLWDLAFTPGRRLFLVRVNYSLQRENSRIKALPPAARSVHCLTRPLVLALGALIPSLFPWQAGIWAHDTLAISPFQNDFE